MGGIGNRGSCGWCANGVTYHDQTLGPKCIDQRDKGPDGGGYTCRTSELQNYHCPAFFDCNYTTGQCIQSKTPGEGHYATKAECNPHCFVVPPAEKLYKCNVSNPEKYVCEVCKDGEEHCSPQDEACSQCLAPPPKKYKCDKTDPQQPKCANCENASETGCGDIKTACKDCDPRPKPQPVKRFQCNKTTHQCKESNDSTALPLSACDTACSNSTPSDLKNTVWRGIAAQNGFKKGEFDLKLGDSSFELKCTPASACEAMSGTVASSFDETTLTITTGKNKGHELNFNARTVDQGTVTTTRAFMFGGLDEPAPQSVKMAMSDAKGMVLLLAKCNAGQGKGTHSTCDFSSVFPSSFSSAFLQLAAAQEEEEDTLRVLARGLSAEQQEEEKRRVSTRQQPVDADPCNEYKDCHACISASVAGFKCGWCIGAEISYNNSVMPTGQKCAGQPLQGQFNPFKCPKKYSTENCEGYTCDWNAPGGPTCKVDDTGNGQWPSKDQCEKLGDCDKNQSKTMQKCNFQEKKCESCQMGEPDCYTQSFCDQSGCATKQYQKCNHKTKQCENCTPKKFGDPNCSDSSADCGKVCSTSTFGKCNHDTGLCEPCEPTDVNSTGCVQGCSDTCKKVDPPKPPDSQRYKCQYWPTIQCVNASKNDTEGKTKEDCEKDCHPEEYAKCNTKDGKCYTCNKTAEDPECLYTKDVCNADCKKQGQINGVWRGVQINKGFVVGEWDFDFTVADLCRITFTGDKQEVYMTKPTLSDGASSGTSTATFEFDTAVPGNILGVKSGDKLNGIFQKFDGQSDVFEVMYLATAKTSGDPAPKDFESAMSDGFEFDLYSCKSNGQAGCDFTQFATQSSGMRIN